MTLDFSTPSSLPVFGTDFQYKILATSLSSLSYYGTFSHHPLPTPYKCHLMYRVTHHVVQNLPLTSKHKFRFGLARPGQARQKRNFCFEVNGRF